MPTSLTGNKISLTYPQIIHVNGGVTGTAKALYDGDGTATILKVSTSVVEISGNLTVAGTLTSVNTTNLQVDDSLIQLGRDNDSSDVVDIGFVGLYDAGGTDKYAGLFRDANDSGKFKLFIDSQEDLSTTNTINTSATGYAVATLVANLEAATVNIDGGNIDGTTIATSDITVGSSKTLNVSSGTLTTSQAQKLAIVQGVGANTDIGDNDFRAQTITADSLTSGRVVFAGTNGVLSDDGDLTFSGDTLTATKLGAFTATGAINFDSQDMTNVDIDSGAIDGTNIGANSPGTGAFTTLTASTSLSITGESTFTRTSGSYTSANLSEIAGANFIQFKPDSTVDELLYINSVSGGSVSLSVANAAGDASNDLILQPFGSNVGIGKTSIDMAQTARTALEIGAEGTFYSHSSSAQGNVTGLGHNYYYSSDGTPKFMRANEESATMEIYNGGFYFYSDSRTDQSADATVTPTSKLTVLANGNVSTAGTLTSSADMGSSRDTGMNLRSTNSSGYGFAVNFQANDGTDDDRIVARLYSEPNDANTSDFRIATRSGGTLANRLTITGNDATFAGALTAGDTTVGQSGNQTGILHLHSRVSSGGSRKTQKITAEPYDESREDVIIIGLDAQSGSNELHIGSNTSANESPTSIDFYTATANDSATNNRRMTINSAGAITSTSQPAFQVVPASIQSNIAAGSTNVTVVFGTERFDQGSNFASNTFTAPVTGRYQFNIMVRLDDVDTASNWYMLGLFTSNKDYEQFIDPDYHSGDFSLFVMTMSVLADMDANDTAAVIVKQHSGAVQTDIDTTSHFSGFLAC